jgi:hypothetical protein
MMSKLQEQMAGVRRQLASQPNTQLNDQGHKLVRNAERGLRDVNEAEGSALAKSLADDFQRAYDREIWEVVGLAAPYDQWEARAQALREALLPLFANRPDGPAEVETAWATCAAGNPLLQDCDGPTVCNFLRQRLFDQAAPPSDAASAVNAPEPVPPVRTRPPRRSLEPAGLWLFSPQNAWVKAQALLALVALVVASGMQLSESRDRRTRDAAYQSLLAAVVAHDDLGVVRAAEAFFSVRPHAADGREAEARRVYDEAFAHWFVAQGYTLDASARTHLAKYATLQSPEARP